MGFCDLPFLFKFWLSDVKITFGSQVGTARLSAVSHTTQHSSFAFFWEMSTGREDRFVLQGFVRNSFGWSVDSVSSLGLSIAFGR